MPAAWRALGPRRTHTCTPGLAATRPHHNNNGREPRQGVPWPCARSAPRPRSPHVAGLGLVHHQQVAVHLVHQLGRNPAQRHPQLVGSHEVVFLRAQGTGLLRGAGRLALIPGTAARSYPVFAMGQAVVADFHCQVGGEQAVPQGQVAGGREGGSVVGPGWGHPGPRGARPLVADGIVVSGWEGASNQQPTPRGPRPRSLARHRACWRAHVDRASNVTVQTRKLRPRKGSSMPRGPLGRHGLAIAGPPS